MLCQPECSGKHGAVYCSGEVCLLDGEQVSHEIAHLCDPDGRLSLL